MLRRMFVGFVLMICAFAPQTLALSAIENEASSTNLLTNSGFEEGDYSATGAPNGWRTGLWSTAVGTTFAWDNANAHGGSKSVRIDAPVANDAFWLQNIVVEPNTDYLLSGWIRTENVRQNDGNATGAGANLTVFDTWTHTDGLFGNNDWSFVSVRFNSGNSSTAIVGGRLGYWASDGIGSAWFDDIQVTPIESGQLQNPGFEEATGLSPRYWSNQYSLREADLRLDDTTAHGGVYSAKIYLPNFGTGRWFQDRAIEQDTEYELSGWIKSENVVDAAGQGWITGARLTIQGLDSYLAKSTDSIGNTQDWHYLSIRFPSGSTSRARISCALGDGNATSSGTAWCDDLSLTKIRAIPRVRSEGSHVQLDLYDYLHALLFNPTGYVTNLDQAYEAFADLTGYLPLNGQRLVLRSEYPMNYGALAGDPIRLTSEQYWYNDINQSGGLDFGGTHELSHLFDIPQSRFYMGGDFINAEVWANIKLLYVFDTLGATHPELTVNAPYNAGAIPIGQLGQVFVDRAARPWLNAGKNNYQAYLDNLDGNAGNAYTGLIYMIRQQVGWEPFKALFREFAAMDQQSAPASDLDKVELMANLLSQHSAINLIPAFRSWGFPIRAEIDRCAGFTIYEKDGVYNAPGWNGNLTVGDKRNNSLNGSENADLILGSGGNDLINGKGGGDILCGGDGVDFLLGNSGDDVLDGGLDNDVLNGGSGDYDQLYAYDGNDSLLDGDGVSVASGGAGKDDLIIVLRKGWRNDDGQPIFDGMTAGYGTDKAWLSIADSTPFTLTISGDEYDDPASADEGKNDRLGLLANVEPTSNILKFESIWTPRSDEVVAPAEDAGAEYLSETVGEEAVDTVYLPLVTK